MRVELGTVDMSHERVVRLVSVDDAGIVFCR